MSIEWHVVTEHVWLNEGGCGISRRLVSKHQSLAVAKREGMRKLGHDDFCIAKVFMPDGRMMHYGWMGEDRGDTPEDLELIAASLGWRYQP